MMAGIPAASLVISVWLLAIAVASLGLSSSGQIAFGLRPCTACLSSSEHAEPVAKEGDS